MPVTPPQAGGRGGSQAGGLESAANMGSESDGIRMSQPMNSSHIPYTQARGLRTQENRVGREELAASV